MPKALKVPELSEQTKSLIDSGLQDIKDGNFVLSPLLEPELIVFRKEEPVVLAGVQSTNWKLGWKNSKAMMYKGGVLFDIPGYRKAFVPMSCIRQVEFKI